MKHLILAASTLGVAVSASRLHARAPDAWSDYTKNGVFFPSPDADSWRTLYARSLQLPDDSLLLSWEDYTPDLELTSWPNHRSTDGGATFSPLSRVEDTAHGVGNWYQPFLYSLPEDFGGYAAGTTLISGATTPRNLSEAWITLYASTDQGVTWEYVSDIVYGPGPETITNGDKAVWDPYLMIPNLKTWGDEVDVVAEPNYGARPGMAVIAHSEDSGKYVMTYEYCGAPEGGCPVYYKAAFSPLDFQSVQGLPLVPGGNAASGPYVIWTRDYNGDGVFIASATSREELFVNTDSVDPDGWEPVDVGQWSAYSRSLRVVNTPDGSIAGGKRKLFIANGGNIDFAGDYYNYVADALVDIPSAPRK
ncbi:hypothetical protein KC316_g179 [Hortaea werneckii]|nr:hypothetical protein KC324_g226 [Hortaea werneckii]KAI7595942.1 hypothetical protein KC316_g179 [Hortaea werneckii]